MDVLNMPESPTAEAPPAYEFSQQEFDQKVSAAVQRSIVTEEEDTRARAKKRSSSGDWEKWDEDAYHEAARRLAAKYGEGSTSSQDPTASEAGPSSSTSATAVTYVEDSFEPDPYADEPQTAQSIRPLSIQKRNKAPQVPVVDAQRDSRKERPSWFEEAQLGENSTKLPSPNGHVPSSQMPSRRSLPASSLQQPLDTESVMSDSSDEDHSVVPPPPFALVDNSLDGPAYERYPSYQGRPPSNQVVLSYSGDPSASPPNSPPQSPSTMHARMRNPYDMHTLDQALPHSQSTLHPQQQPLNQQQRRTPQPGRAQARPNPPRPVSASAIKTTPRLDFNPSLAYGRPTYGERPTEAPSASGGAAALYNSAVASLLPVSQNASQTATSAPPARKPTPSMISTRSADYYQTQQPQHLMHSYTSSYPTQLQPLGSNQNAFYSPQRPARPMSSLSQGDQRQVHWHQPVHVQQQQQQFYPR